MSGLKLEHSSQCLIPAWTVSWLVMFSLQGSKLLTKYYHPPPHNSLSLFMIMDIIKCDCGGFKIVIIGGQWKKWLWGVTWEKIVIVWGGV